MKAPWQDDALREWELVRWSLLKPRHILRDNGTHSDIHQYYQIGLKSDNRVFVMKCDRNGICDDASSGFLDRGTCCFWGVVNPEA
jgi:hypothetical protein